MPPALFKLPSLATKPVPFCSVVRSLASIQAVASDGILHPNPTLSPALALARAPNQEILGDCP